VLGLSSTARYAAAFTGAAAVAAILFAAGRELRQWMPRHVSRSGGVLGLLVMPTLIGTALVIMVNQPTPMGPGFISGRASEILAVRVMARGISLTP
jgi:ABC-type Fe3+ transport system permease subunit